MAFTVFANNCTYLGKSTYPRTGGQIGTQIHLLSGVESAKVACDSTVYENAPVDGTKCNVKLDFLNTKKGNFLKALEIIPLANTAK